MDETTGEPMLDADGNPLTTEVPLDEPVYYYTTKGDANEAADAGLVHCKNVLGTPVASIPYLGYVITWIQNPPGTYIAISAAALIINAAALDSDSKEMIID